MIDINELRSLVQAVIGWGCCNQAWLDQSEDTPAVVVGHINEDGETYPVVTIDCDQYSAAGQSLPLGKFYAAANPAVINEILNRLEAAEEERDALRAELTDLRNSMAFRTSLIGRIEAEREDLHALIAAVKKQVNAEFRLRMKKEIERDTLQARVEAMEKQEPVARTTGEIREWVSNGDGTYSLGGCIDAFAPLPDETKLYLAPGAKGE